MPQDLFHYDRMIEQALRGVVREALLRASREGLPGAHHFYIGFATREPGVELPASLRAKFPDEMTIVIQHQFWDLEIREDAFSVTLSFQRQPERLAIPFAAIKSFADPSVNFALEFASPVTASAASEPAESPALPAPVAAPPPAAEERTTGEVVALDAFRKR
ncbi:MAG TPA: ClpXP protease specificity-enhancing factor SspB [Stellaceae bacterium]|nr:ClpXP protease specificity-enhancing factor SspB [Stellaceae bacterium]